MIHCNDFSGIYIYELWGFCGFWFFFFFLLKWLWTRVITYHFHFNSIWQIVLDGESNTASLNGYSVSASCRALNALCYRSLDRTQAEYLICYKAEMWQGWINLLGLFKAEFQNIFFLTNLSFFLSLSYIFFFPPEVRAVCFNCLDWERRHWLTAACSTLIALFMTV